MDATEHNSACPVCRGPRRFDKTLVVDPLYMRDGQCVECWIYDQLPDWMKGLEWTDDAGCPKSHIPWLDIKSPHLREQARLLPCKRRPR